MLPQKLADVTKAGREFPDLSVNKALHWQEIGALDRIVIDSGHLTYWETAGNGGRGRINVAKEDKEFIDETAPSVDVRSTDDISDGHFSAR